MKRIIIIYGIISGFLVSVLMTLAMAFKDEIGMDKGMLVGYTSMILSLSLIFFAIQSYKKIHGAVNFKQSILIGLGMTAVCSILYTICWAIVYHNFMPNYLQDYQNYQLGKLRESGASEAVMQKSAAEMSKWGEWYKTPLGFILFTLIEIVPVGLLVSLIAAFVELYKNKNTQNAAA